jgi:hypothetical protein
MVEKEHRIIQVPNFSRALLGVKGRSEESL